MALSYLDGCSLLCVHLISQGFSMKMGCIRRWRLMILINFIQRKSKFHSSFVKKNISRHINFKFHWPNQRKAPISYENPKCFLQLLEIDKKKVAFNLEQFRFSISSINKPLSKIVLTSSTDHPRFHISPKYLSSRTNDGFPSFNRHQARLLSGNISQAHQAQPVVALLADHRREHFSDSGETRQATNVLWI